MSSSPEQAVLAELNEVFHRIFDNPDIVVLSTTSAKDIPEWDSLNHATLISEVETHFKIKFSLKEIVAFQTVGDMCAVICRKTQRSGAPAA